jgi:hypothetical protein
VVYLQERPCIFFVCTKVSGKKDDPFFVIGECGLGPI